VSDESAREPDTATPAVSVVVPTRNRPNHLELTLASVLAQCEVSVEVIVVHDGPDLHGHAIAPAERLRDASVSIVKLKRTAGMAAARNAGVARARGKWVAFLDDDDLWSPDKLRGQVSAAKSDVGLVYSSAVSIDDRRRVIAAFPAPDPHSLLRRLLAVNIIPAGSSNALVRRETFMEAGGFDESFVHLADWDAWIRIAALTPAAADLSVAVAYTHHPGTMSQRHPAELFAEMRRLRSKHRALADSLGVSLDEARFNRWVAGGQHRAGRRLSAARLYLASGVRHGNVGDIARGAQATLGLDLPRGRRVPTVPWLHSSTLSRG
jgi:hypothetical protein